MRSTCAILTVAMVACVLSGAPALAQRAGENAVANADDAFGTSVGLEQSGIYSEYDTRGFSPLKAGNVRIDGVYFDPVASLSGRLRSSTAIRVGLSAVDFPFVAPTGVVDHKFKPFPKELGFSVSATEFGYMAVILEADARIPVIKDHLAITGGLAYADTRSFDGANTQSWGWTLRPILRAGGFEIAPFASTGHSLKSKPNPLVIVPGAIVPTMQARRKYLGQDWLDTDHRNDNYGVTVRGRIGENFGLRAGVFKAIGERRENYSELFTIIGPGNRASHVLIADPLQDVHSTSGEALVVWHRTSGRWAHRVYAGYRARDRYTETGGSDIRNYGLVEYGERDPEPRPARFDFSPVNQGRLRQSSLMIGYLGKLEGVGRINLGLQKARYRARSKSGATGALTLSRDDPWLYNVMALAQVSRSMAIYAGTERGLEDSGVAPESAVNRNEQLPATRSTQYEGGVSWKFHAGHLVLDAFQISKPYFSADSANRFVEVGTVRHRGVEASFVGHLDDRLNLLAGAVLMKPRVIGAAVDQGLIGKRPTGVPNLFARIDLTYRTDWLHGFTPTASVVYNGRRAAGSRPQAQLGGRQLMVGSITSVDIGARQGVHLGKVDASLRVVVQNVFDEHGWRVPAANLIRPDSGRRVTATLAADF